MTCGMIEGDWTIIAVEYGGEALPGRTGRLEIVGERFALQLAGTPREVGRVEYTAGVATASETDTLDLVWREAGNREIRRLRAIVRRRGELMQFCYYPDAAAGRPGAFRSDGAIPAILVRCKRRTDD